MCIAGKNIGSFWEKIASGIYQNYWWLAFFFITVCMIFLSVENSKLHAQLEKKPSNADYDFCISQLPDKKEWCYQHWVAHNPHYEMK